MAGAAADFFCFSDDDSRVIFGFWFPFARGGIKHNDSKPRAPPPAFPCFPPHHLLFAARRRPNARADERTLASLLRSG